MSASRRRGIFLSYAWEDLEEVRQLDQELRLRGVPLWRDQTDLRPGKLSESEIRGAIDACDGVAIYVTPHAAASSWVRETELLSTLARIRRSANVRLIPIFRGDPDVLSEAFSTNGLGSDKSLYDLRPHAGYRIDTDRLPAFRREELQAAADRVLAAYLGTLDERVPRSAAVKVGLATRGGPALARHRLDLLVDWTAEYPEDRRPSRGVPASAHYQEVLEPALEHLKTHLAQVLGDRRLRIVPQCHLTMALALGFRFRRNVHFDLEVQAKVSGETDDGEIWQGPAVPRTAMPGGWSFRDLPGSGRGKGIAAGVNVTQPEASFLRDVRSCLETVADARGMLYAEPAAGRSKTVLAGLDPHAPHRMSVALVEAIEHHPAYADADAIHLFFAGPAALAVLLGQALSNVRPVQTYEWLGSERRYEPCFELVSS